MIRVAAKQLNKTHHVCAGSKEISVCKGVTNKQTSHNTSQCGAKVVAIKKWFLRTRKFFETAPGTVAS